MTSTNRAAGNQSAAKEMTFLIEIGDKDAGLAIMESGRARFIASDPAFMPLDNRHFRDLSALVKAARALDEKRHAGAETPVAQCSMESDRIVA